MTCCSILVALLAACGSSATTSNPTPTPTLAPKPSPTIPSTPTPSLSTYTRNGFTIGYPQNWKVTPSGTVVTIVDSSGLYVLEIIASPNPIGTISADRAASAALTSFGTILKNRKTVNVAPTATIGGDTWVQKALVGTSGQTVIQYVIVSDNHPANTASTKNFSIIYGTSQNLFDSGNTSYFQPMLQSFKFTP